MTRLSWLWPAYMAAGICLIIIGGGLLRQAFRPISIGQVTT